MIRYSSVFIFMFLISSFIAPLSAMIMLKVLSVCKEGSVLFNLITDLLPRFFLPRIAWVGPKMKTLKMIIDPIVKIVKSYRPSITTGDIVEDPTVNSSLVMSIFNIRSYIVSIGQ